MYAYKIIVSLKDEPQPYGPFDSSLIPNIDISQKFHYQHNGQFRAGIEKQDISVNINLPYPICLFTFSERNGHTEYQYAALCTQKKTLSDK